jgi:hypothetical protein
MAYAMNDLNLYCRQEAIVAIVDASRDKPFEDEDDHRDMASLQDEDLDDFLRDVMEKDLYCHSFNKVTWRPSHCPSESAVGPGSRSVPSG